MSFNPFGPYKSFRSCVESLLHLVPGIYEESVIPRAKELDPTDTGGWFTVWSPIEEEDTGLHASPLFGFVVGKIGAYKAASYQNYAIEKARRLAGRPKDVSSWQSRDVSQAQYGGAIRTDSGLILSFSGLDEHFDELGVLIVGKRSMLLSDEQLVEIVAASDNPHARTHFNL